MPSTFEKSVRAFREEVREYNKSDIFYNDPDAKQLCKLVYYGWLMPKTHGADGIYAAFLKTKHIGDPESRAFTIAEKIARPWTLGEFWKIFLSILEQTSRPDVGETIKRRLVNTEIPNLISTLEKTMAAQNLIWYTPYLAAALVEMQQEHLTYQAEYDRADEATRRVEKMLILEEQSNKPGIKI